jgi:hypothetical protein
MIPDLVKRLFDTVILHNAFNRSSMILVNFKERQPVSPPGTEAKHNRSEEPEAKEAAEPYKEDNNQRTVPGGDHWPQFFEVCRHA